MLWSASDPLQLLCQRFNKFKLSSLCDTQALNDTSSGNAPFHVLNTLHGEHRTEA